MKKREEKKKKRKKRGNDTWRRGSKVHKSLTEPGATPCGQLNKKSIKMLIKMLLGKKSYFGIFYHPGAYAAQVYSLCASVTAVYLPFLVFGRLLTRLDLHTWYPFTS